MTESRVGVYVCHCGHNIAGAVDVEHLSEWALGLPQVVVARNYQFMCAGTGQELIEKDIQEYGLTHVVVASCSPHMHEKTFRNACERAGLNAYLFEMANIREHASWVHPNNRSAATSKAKALVSAAVHRVLKHQALEPMRVEIQPTTLVVGGGIAGIQAALEIADAGYPVYVVEREPSIGGHMAQLTSIPDARLRGLHLTRKMSSRAPPNITLLTYSEIEQVDGSVGNFRVTVRRKARKVREDVCTGCGTCWEKCPVKVVDGVFEAGLGYRKAIYRPFPQAVPKYPVIDVELYLLQNRKMRDSSGMPGLGDRFRMQDEIVTMTVGNIILADRLRHVRIPRRIPQSGYGRLYRVHSLEFERLTNAAGRPGGKITLRDGVKTEPRSVAIIHCVGCRIRTNEYCSAICSMSSLKFAHLAKKRPKPKSTTSTTTCGRSHGIRGVLPPHSGRRRAFYPGARGGDHGRRYGRRKAASWWWSPRTLIGRTAASRLIMVILAVGLEPARDSQAVSHLFGVGCGDYGSSRSAIPSWTGGDRHRGALHRRGLPGAEGLPDTVAQGAAAAARVLA
jgi:heterodisulfide reductase subunit A